MFEHSQGVRLPKLVEGIGRQSEADPTWVPLYRREVIGYWRKRGRGVRGVVAGDCGQRRCYVEHGACKRANVVQGRAQWQDPAEWHTAIGRLQTHDAADARRVSD